MYGWKARIGLIIPSSNTTIEPEFNAMKPEGVSVHTARLLHVSGGSKEGLQRMAEGTEEAAKLLATAGVNVIAYACTTGSLVKGAGWDQELIHRIETATDIPATTTSTTVVRALRELGVGKVALATPYNEVLTQAVREFLEANGIKVVNVKGIGINSEGMRRSPPEITYKLACEVNTAEADAVFISCTGFKTITVIEKLEEELKKYVFSSNIATMWNVLKRLGIRDQIKGYGKLMQMLSR